MVPGDLSVPCGVDERGRRGVDFCVSVCARLVVVLVLVGFQESVAQKSARLCTREYHALLRTQLSRNGPMSLHVRG